MPSMEEIVNVVITQEGATVTQAGFGTGLILTPHVKGSGTTPPPRLEYFNTLADLAVRHPSTTEAYKAAAAYFSQSPAPQRVAVGRRQVNAINVTITVVNSFLYSVSINGTAYTYTSDGTALEQEIVDGLIAAVAASPVTGSDGGVNTLTLTADVAGVGFSVAVGTNLAVGTATGSDTIANDLTAIQAEQPDWYGVVLTDRASADMQAAAVWVEANKKFLFASSQEAGVLTTGTTDLIAVLDAANYKRTAGFYHASANANYIDAAAMGRALALEPGTYTMKFKTLAGIAVSSLTSTESTNARNKSGNVYELIGGVSMVREGTVSNGDFIDTIIGLDWLEARMEERVFGKMAALLKIPFTDAGIGIVEAEIRAQLQQGVERTFLAADPAFTVTVPKAADVSSANKALRTLPDVKFRATLAGAIHKTTINGVVSV